MRDDLGDPTLSAWTVHRYVVIFFEMLRFVPGLTRRLLSQVSSRLQTRDDEAAERIAQG